MCRMSLRQLILLLMSLCPKDILYFLMDVLFSVKGVKVTSQKLDINATIVHMESGLVRFRFS